MESIRVFHPQTLFRLANLYLIFLPYRMNHHQSPKSRKIWVFENILCQKVLPKIEKESILHRQGVREENEEAEIKTSRKKICLHQVYVMLRQLALNKKTTLRILKRQITVHLWLLRPLRQTSNYLPVLLLKVFLLRLRTALQGKPSLGVEFVAKVNCRIC